MTPFIQIKRVYDSPLKSDGYRVLIDRLWPRGMSKKAAAIDAWAKELAPSTGLRRWFGHEPLHWKEFQRRYRSELKENRAVEKFMQDHASKKAITLVFGAKDILHTHALILQDFLQKIDDYGEK